MRILYANPPRSDKTMLTFVPAFNLHSMRDFSSFNCFPFTTIRICSAWIPSTSQICSLSLLTWKRVGRVSSSKVSASSSNVIWRTDWEGLTSYSLYRPMMFCLVIFSFSFCVRRTSRAGEMFDLPLLSIWILCRRLPFGYFFFSLKVDYVGSRLWTKFCSFLRF